MKRRDRHARAFYNLTAPLQDGLFRITAWLDGVDARRERQRLIDHLNVAPGQFVLEVGPGAGQNLSLIAQRMEGNGPLLGVDISREMLKRSRNRLKKKQPCTALIVGNGSHLPLAADQADAVLQFGGFNHFEEKEKVVREMMRVARPGAMIVISDKCVAPQRSWRQKVLAKMFPYLVAQPPIEIIPLSPEQIALDWFWNDRAYILSFANS